MSDLKNMSHETIAIMSGKLIVGNHDTITLFGRPLQEQLNDITKDILDILLNSNIDIYKGLNEILAEIEEAEEISQLKRFSIFKREKYSQKTIDKYKRILSCIEEATLYLKLQQAQLIKELALLKKYDITVNEYIIELEQYLQSGNEFMRKQEEIQQNLGQDNTSSLNILSDIDFWFKRLAKRLDDLKVLRIIALQNASQIKLLYSNNLVLVDRIVETISFIFPYWKIKIELIFNLETQANQLEVQNELLRYSKENIKNISIELDKHKPAETILELNKELSSALNTFIAIETNNENIRNAIKKLH